MVRANAKQIRYLRGAAILGAMLVCASMVVAQKSKRPKSRAKAPATPGAVAPAAAPVPFRAGEILEYRVLFSKYSVNAAKIETSVVEQRTFFGRLAWHRSE